MKMTEGIMGMSVAVEILDDCNGVDIDEVLDYFHEVDEMFSPYKKTSEISKINSKRMRPEEASPEVKKIFKLSEETKTLTHGYFNIEVEGVIDPSGLVKGYAISEASKRLYKKGYRNYYIEIGGDIDVRGLKNGLKWKVGIRNPLSRIQNFRIAQLTNVGIATSGTYARGMHIYDPVKKKLANEVASATVIGNDAFEADRMATAVYAMGEKGIAFLEEQKDLEAYMVLHDGKEKMTTGFSKYLA